MACCGGSTVKTATPGESVGASGPTLFEYSGDGPLTLFGRMTGVRYHFPGPGSRLHVDARDAPVLAIMRGLEAVGAS